MPVSTTNGNAPTGGIDIDLPAAVSSRVVLMDLDEIIEAAEFCGRELVVIYTDHASRRQLVRVRGQRRNGRKAVTS
jgi:hypothetical protein